MSFFGGLVDKQDIIDCITWCAWRFSSGIATRFSILAILPEAKPGIFEHLHHSSCGRPIYAEKESLELSHCAVVLLRRVVNIPICNCTILPAGVQQIQNKNIWHSLFDHWASHAILGYATEESLELDCSVCGRPTMQSCDRPNQLFHRSLCGRWTTHAEERYLSLTFRSQCPTTQYCDHPFSQFFKCPTHTK